MKVWVVVVNYGGSNSAEADGAFSTREKAQFYLDYIRDQGGAYLAVEELIVDELVSDVKDAP